MFAFSDYLESSKVLESFLGSFKPRITMILGSGLGNIGELVEEPITVSYSEIPYLPCSTAPGHKGRFVFGWLEGVPVAVMQGRVHHYEGYSFEEVTFAVRILHLLGCDTLIVTNAAGCVNVDWNAGDLMLIRDHIKLFLESPLRGENIEEFGPRFPDCTHLYTPSLMQIARDVAQEQGIVLREGVYMYFPGPQYETPAEVNFARIAGADATGMSTVPEVLTAGHCGMDVLGLTLLSNMAAGILDKPLTEKEVLEAGAAAEKTFSKLVLGCLRNM